MALVFGLIALGVLALIALSFIKLDTRPVVQSKIIPYSISEVWESLYHKEHYLNSKKEIIKYAIYDTLSPRWVEYYSPNDSVENTTISMTQRRTYHYAISNRKYEQTHDIRIALDSIAPDETKVSITEKSIYLNNWSNIYFRLFRKTTVADFEILKIENTLTSMHSQTQKQ